MIGFIHLSYFLAAILFLLGLKKMSHPRTARPGIVWAGVGMLLAVLVTFLLIKNNLDLTNFILIISAMVIGTVLAWVSGKRVAMTAMPQIIALYNGMGGGAAAAIAASETLSSSHHLLNLTLALIGGLIGMIAFSGSLIAFAKLQGIIRKTITLPLHNISMAIFGLIILGLLGVLLFYSEQQALLAVYFGLLFLYGIFMTLSIGGANMPVVISLFNAMTGLAVAFEGFVLANPLMMVAGIIVGASGTLLTLLMAKAINQSVTAILFTPHHDGPITTQGIEGTLKPINATDAGVMLAYAQKIIIVPGYGMAVAQAQNKIWELAKLLMERQIQVKFAIHPVAGRMPGHMNVLLAEAGVPYDFVFTMDEINEEFAATDVAMVIGANDIVNPIASQSKESPLYGLPVLHVERAKNVIVIKRGQGRGFSGVENSLFYMDHTRMLYGNAQPVISELIQAVKQY
ncbi:NAD(P)(+) transhydrogenase (Re/Si-specific) subunit beta [Coxiella burnetii]|uniref:NAD(P)(+) transhydrogenase (Re/Si-specific) subunit beta n=1 Tax=Coxiella burnetii TaxID=777 RepID=UPI001EDF0BDD|nr:NAD(P)(+) transhydrogenase (Re/Si-specific) subunit beta [Coxiella burnetii]UYK69631.1 NAD(P)(+) transhydrogenase (Re/Si-specific) subunit beta [Coxiella burnetii]